MSTKISQDRSDLTLDKLYIRWSWRVASSWMDPFPGWQCQRRKCMVFVCLFCFVCVFFCHSTTVECSTHWGRDKMHGGRFADGMLDSFYWMKIYEFQSRFHWSFIPRVQLTISSIGSDNDLTPARQQLSHYLNQWWWVYWRIYAPLGLNELKILIIFFSALHDIFPSCAHVQAVYMYSFLSFNPYFCLLYRHLAIGDHYAPKHNLLNIVMLGDIFKSKITHKLSLLHYTKTSY